MSRELIFYPAFIDKENGKIKPLLTNVKGNPAEIFWRSGSFIDMDWFIHELPMIDPNNFDDSCKEYFLRDNELFSNNGEVMTYIYMLNEETLHIMGGSHGVISGYVPLEDLESYYQAEYPQEYLYWQMPTPMPTDVYVELPEETKKQYGKLYAVNTYSKEYVCSVLAEIIEDIYIPWDWKGEPCMLVYYSF